MKLCLSLLLSSLFLTSAFAEDLSAEQSAALLKQVEIVKQMAADPKIVENVKSTNATPFADYKDMSQDAWKALSVLDPKVRFFSKTPAAEVLKAKKNDMITEAFVN